MHYSTLDLWGDVGTQCGQRRRRLEKLLGYQLCNVARKRWTAAKHVVGNRSKRVDICPDVQCHTFLHLLRSHIFRRTNDASGFRTADRFRPIRMDDLGESEVAHLNETVIIGVGCLTALLHYENVRRLQVTMQYAFVMSGFNSGYNLTEEGGGTVYVESAFATEELVKRFALDVFHHQEKNAFRTFPEIRHIYDVGVPD
jgi:hypothetical protein